MLSLRRAGVEDADLLRSWRNDPTTREASFSSREVSREEHARWLAEKLEDANCALFIVEDAGEPIGQVRLDRVDQDEAEVSIALASAARGKGIGREALRLAKSHAARSLGVKKLTARVKCSNSASLAAFRAAGFSPAGGNESVIDFILFL
jgi:RimJ/RimL family protein N-acetyltransferase